MNTRSAYPTLLRAAGGKKAVKKQRGPALAPPFPPKGVPSATSAKATGEVPPYAKGAALPVPPPKKKPALPFGKKKGR